MLKIKLFVVILLASLTSFANSAPANSNLLLWRFSPSDHPGQKTKQFCATSKQAPYTPILCFGETLRSDLGQKPEGYIQYQPSENSPNKQIFKITQASTWKFLYRETQYVANADVYERNLTVEDATGRQYILTEVFGYFANNDDYDKFRTREIHGNLPFGPVLSLKNIYLFQ